MARDEVDVRTRIGKTPRPVGVSKVPCRRAKLAQTDLKRVSLNGFPQIGNHMVPEMLKPDDPRATFGSRGTRSSKLQT